MSHQFADKQYFLEYFILSNKFVSNICDFSTFFLPDPNVLQCERDHIFSQHRLHSIKYIFFIN